METNHLDEFDNIAKSLCELHREKNKSYGGAFYETCKELGQGGKFYAVGCLKAKVGRLTSIVVNEGLNTFGESMEDSLKDLASYAIMTIASIRGKNNKEGL